MRHLHKYVFKTNHTQHATNARRACLSPLLSSLRVQSHNNSNLMDSKNLALVFAPSIMRPLGPSNDAAIMIKLPEQKKVTELLISQYPILFS